MIGWNEEIKKEFGYCGQNVYIGHNTIFTNPSKVFLGDNVRIDPFCLITTGLITSSNIQICSHAVLGGGNQHTITMGEWTFIGYGSKLFCASEDYSGNDGPVNEFWGNNKIFRGDITFRNYSGIASDVIVFPGITLPIGCTIGAKSLVRNQSSLVEWAVIIDKQPVKRRNAEKIIELAKSKEFHK